MDMCKKIPSEVCRKQNILQTFLFIYQIYSAVLADQGW